jgi:tetratricopeptide (TPR) repeat protein
VKAFVPRPLLYDQIRTQLWNVDVTANKSTKTLVVWGLGGAGKSQLVLNYVQQCCTDYQTTFWFEAGRKESLERDFINLYQTLFNVQMVAGKETVSVESAVIGVKSWFSGQRGPWLMVFDGADTIENEEAGDYIDIKHFIPDVASLHVIITSRSRTAKDMTRLDGVHVGEMEEAEATELFYQYAQLRRNNQEAEHKEVKAIIKELGYLALAVTLAGTYVGQSPRLQSDIKAYLPEYRSRRRELLKRNPEQLIHQYSESVLTTWETSYQAIVDHYPEASTLMTMLSFLSFDDIFLPLFGIRSIVTTTLADDAATVSWRSILFPSRVVDIYLMEQCFQVLQKYSFVQWKAGQCSYAMHKLVHAWGYDRLTRDEQDKFSVATLTLILEAVNGCGNAPADKLRLVPHIMAHFATIAGVKEVVDSTLSTLVAIGIFVTDIGRLSEGHVIKEFIWAKRRSILGDEHPSTISAMNNLANTLGDLGQLDEAAKMMKGVLEKMRRILGDEHPSTISAMNNLASMLGDLGQLDEAVALLEAAEEKTRRVRGDQHPHTKVVVRNLARLRTGKAGIIAQHIKISNNIETKRGHSLYARTRRKLRKRDNIE